MEKKILAIGILSSIAFAPLTQAASAFFDDFEDGNHDGWSVVGSGSGGGGTGVFPDASTSDNQAWAWHKAEGFHSLSRDFSYMPNSTVSFDMKATATRDDVNYVGNIYSAHASSGITISFLTSLNVELGSTSLWYGSAGNGTISDQNWHTYSASMESLATLAGTNPGDSLDKMSLTFWAASNREVFGGIPAIAESNSAVGFDDVRIDPVPLPPAVWLFGSSLLGMISLGKRRKR